jgi:hypothetical protein
MALSAEETRVGKNGQPVDAVRYSKQARRMTIPFKDS